MFKYLSLNYKTTVINDIAIKESFFFCQVTSLKPAKETIRSVTTRSLQTLSLREGCSSPPLPATN